LEKANYKVVRANKEQLESVLADNRVFNQEKKDIYFGFVAVDEDKNIIGYLIAYEKDISVSSVKIKRWWIEHTFVRPELRQQGIADALVKAIIKYAEESGIMQIESGTTAERIASKMLYLKNDFCFFATGPQDDKGNYQHLILYRIKNI
jgi:GNAT superfamily N-acetyltransferase